ncbi:MAG: fibronectin type III domain-containing protein [Bacteroidetes bacterium]|nr:fibronectin type III domain-containing protein [Bacteroidota bacterium]
MDFKKFRVVLVIALLAFATACDEESTGPVDADVSAPTTIRAASASEAIILNWTPSVSEGQDNFGGYKITVLNKTTNESFFENAPKGSGHTITGLSNGTRYDISVRAVTSMDKESADAATIEWAPAIRRDVNQDGQEIRVYATTSSSFNSAVDLYNASGICEVIPQSGQEFKDRGDLFVYAPNETSNFLVIRTPSAANNQGLETQFSTVFYDSDDLDNQYATTPPATGTYTSPEVTLTNATVSSGKVIYGRLKRSTDYYYFRLLVKRSGSGKLVQGSGADRYLELSVSFQHIRNIPFAKH